MTRGPWPALGLQGLSAAATLCIAVAGTFGLVLAAPGDAIDLMSVDESLRPLLEERWGMDRSLGQRLVAWAREAARGNWGHSLTVRPGTPVLALAGPASLQSGLRLLAAISGGMVLTGILALRGKPGLARPLLALSTWPAFLCIHVAVFTCNEVAYHGLQAGWWARPSWFALPDQSSWLREAIAVGVLATASGTLAAWHDPLASSIQRWRISPEAMARSGRGESVYPMLWRHLLPASAMATSLRVPALVGGLIIVEKLLLLPGAGRLFWDAALLRDHELILALAVGSAMAVIGLRFLLQGVAIGLDPRRWRLT